MNKYNQQFFKDLQQGSAAAARVIIPIIFEYIKPTSVVDVGCGNGTWLSVFAENNIEDVLGIDVNYVNTNTLLIPKSKFYSANLEEPINLGRKFDLVISVEVGEHLLPSKAKIYVTTLTNLAPVILFSAAIPGQGGTHHVNEQWPEYWKEQFYLKNYYLIDCIRNKIWNNDDIPFWYAQNCFLFIEKNFLKKNPLLLKLQMDNEDNNSMLSIVHPRLYSRVHPDLSDPKYIYPRYLINLTKKLFLRLFF